MEHSSEPIFKISLAGKITILSSMLVLFSTTMVGAIFYFGNGKNIEREQFKNVAKEANHLKPHLVSEFKELSNDVSFLAKLPNLVELLETVEEDRSDRFRQELYPFFKTLLMDKKKYVQISIIDSNNRSIELNASRFDRFDERDELPPPTRLKDINLKLSKFRRNKVYLSDIRLLREGMEISSRKIPVVTASKPIFNDSGEPIGLLRITADMNKAFESLLKEVRATNVILYLTNDMGDYLVHPDPEKTFGFEKGKDIKIQNDYIKAINFIQGPMRSLTIKPGLGKSDEIMHMLKIPFDKSNKERFFILTVKQTHDNVLREFNHIRTQSLVSSLALLVAAALGAWLFSRFLTKNLNQIIVAARNFAKGHEVDLNIRSQDEIGEMAKTFNLMARQIGERTYRLVKSEERSRKAKEYAEEISKTKTILLRNLKKQKAEIERISKDKDDLMAIVSHDLKNPLSVIKAGMEHMLEDGQHTLPPDYKDLISRAQSSSEFAINLITDLLEMARLEGGIRPEKRHFEVNKLLNQVMDTFGLESKERNIEFNAHLGSHAWLNADKARVTQVLNNIVGNAMKFTQRGGRITIATRVFERKEMGRWLEITISDNGRGIPEGKIATIFDKYEQARRQDREKGTGLGLAICKNIMQLHGGDITVESEEGRGSTFRMLFPDVALEKPRMVDEFVEKKEGLIMVVDDSPDSVALVKLRMKKIGYDVIEAENGLVALELMKQHRPHLIVLDLDMPEMDGPTFLKTIRQKYSRKELPVIVHSGRLKMGHVDLQDLDANDFMPKPADPTKLLMRVDELMHQRIHQKGSHILVVDDSSDIHALFKIFLKDSPYEATYAKSGPEALELVKVHNFDLMLLDLKMPEWSGSKTLRQIHSWQLKEGFPKLGAIAMTGSDPRSVRHRCLQAGFIDVVGKQSGKQAIFDAIKSTFNLINTNKKAA